MGRPRMNWGTASGQRVLPGRTSSRKCCCPEHPELRRQSPDLVPRRRVYPPQKCFLKCALLYSFSLKKPHCRRADEKYFFQIESGSLISTSKLYTIIIQFFCHGLQGKSYEPEPFNKFLFFYLNIFNFLTDRVFFARRPLRLILRGQGAKNGGTNSWLTMEVSASSILALQQEPCVA